MSIAQVRLWGRMIGAIHWDAEKELGFFEYTPEFARSGIEVSPICMPLSNQIYAFPALEKKTFLGLPGMLSDCLPDKFGNALIDAWLADQGRSSESFNPVERLCYVGSRGMGALEFAPSRGPSEKKSNALNVDALTRLAGDILSKRNEFKVSLLSPHEKSEMENILKIGTSAGGARAKAVIAWNSATQEVRSGQVEADSGFSYWILKFDGVENNRDKELMDPKGYGLIEYAYSRMAVAAGIQMSECRLLRENGRNHFMTKRFDRTESGGKIHTQSLCGLAHYDYNMAGAYSYEQAMDVIRQLNLPMSAIEEQFRRAVFNVVSRNQDDHVKNIAFLMDKSGQWSLSPAFDLGYSYNPQGPWTSRHQMSLNGKRDGFEKNDFIQLEKRASMKRGRGLEILSEVIGAVRRWLEFAADAGVADKDIERIAETHRLNF